MNDTAVFRISIAIAAALSSASACGAGSVVFDNTLPGQPHGTTTTVPLTAGKYTIDAANTGYLSNTNLFESFATFIVGAGEEADFTNANHLAINNVISRVTGIGDPNGLRPTSIDGKLVSSIAGANFWFVNPAGVTVGAGAVINVPAGLAIGTSDYIQFADNSRWYALESGAPTPSVLSTAGPSAFGFLPTPAAGALSVHSAQLSSTAGGDIILAGGSGGTNISASQLSATNSTGHGAVGNIDVSSAGALSLQDTTLTSETFTVNRAGNVSLTSHGALSINNSSLISQTNSEGNAGDISVTAIPVAGADPGTGAVTISGGLITSRADPNAPFLAGQNGGPGNVTLSGPAVLVSSGTIESNSIGYVPAGLVSITASGATGVAAAGGGTGDALLITNGTHISSADGIHAQHEAGGISLQATAGSIRIDSASQVDVNTTDSSPLSLQAATGIAVDAATLSAETSFNGGGSAGSAISLQSQGPITLANGALFKSTNASIGVGDSIELQSSAALTLSGGSSVTTSDVGSGDGPVGDISLTGASVHVAGGTVASSGSPGVVSIIATGADAGNAPALLIDGGAQVTSSLSAGLGFGGGANSGNLQLRADAGTVAVSGSPGTAGGATTLDASGLGPSARAGAIALSGQNVSLQGALLETTTGANSAAGSGAVTLAASGDVLLNNTLINTESTGFGTPAGPISVTGAHSVSITGGQSVSGLSQKNVALFSGSTDRGDAGAISVSAPDGLVTINNATLDTQSLFLASSGSITVSGAGVLVANQSLLASDYEAPGSNNASGPGAISIRATGTVVANDPVQSDLTKATAGVVRIVDSGVTATNSGGVSGNTAGRGQILVGADLPGGSTALTPDVVIAGSLVSTDVLAGGRGNDLTIVGSNSVWIGPSATGGYQAGGAAPAQNDPRFATSPAVQVTGYSRSLISAQTESSAISGGQVLIQGGTGGVSIVSSNVDANDSVDGVNANDTRSTSNITVTTRAAGAVALTDSVITTETSGVNKAGNVLVTGGSIAVTGGELSAASTAADPELPDVGDAGSVALTAQQADPAGGASLSVNGATIRSDATQAAALLDPESGRPTFARSGDTSRLAIPNAGTVTLSSTAGGISVGSNSNLSSAAGPKAGNAGAVSISAPNGTVQVADSTVNTNVASIWTVDVDGNPVPTNVATIAMSAGGGGLSLANSRITADTSGTVAAGSIEMTTSGALQVSGADSLLSSRTSSGSLAGDLQLTGATVAISGGGITASTTGSGNAGNIAITANGADGGGSNALVVKGGASVASDASQGQSAQTNAGYVKLTASNGTVQVGVASDTVSTSISTAAGATAGSPGAVMITGRAIDLGDARISTTAAGTQFGSTRGSIVLNAANGSGSLQVANSTLDAATSGVQQAGEIDLLGAPIQISNSVISSATTGTGPAGAICVSSSCPGASGTGLSVDGGLTRVARLSTGAAAAPGISIANSTLSTSTSTSGAAGDIDVITPGPLVLTGATVLSQSTSPAADAGPVGVIRLIGGAVSLTGGSTVSAISKGGTPVIPEGGVQPAAITIVSTDGSTPMQITDSTITTQAQATNGSNIVIDAGASPVLLNNSLITASAVEGNGGNITIDDAGNMAMQRSAIVAQAGPGNGGAININLKQGALFVQDSESLVSATSQSGNNGTVSIKSPQTDLNTALVVPVVTVARSPELTANVCRPHSSRSTFVSEGRGGVSADPQGYSIGPLADLSAPAAHNDKNVQPPLLVAAPTTTTTTTRGCP